MTKQQVISSEVLESLSAIAGGQRAVRHLAYQQEIAWWEEGSLGCANLSAESK